MAPFLLPILNWVKGTWGTLAALAIAGAAFVFLDLKVGYLQSELEKTALEAAMLADQLQKAEGRAAQANQALTTVRKEAQKAREALARCQSQKAKETASTALQACQNAYDDIYSQIYHGTP